MTTIASRSGGTTSPRRSGWGIGLSGRLALATILLILAAQAIVFVPLAAMYRSSWVSDRLVGAKMAALVLAAYPDDQALPKDVRESLVAGIPSTVIALRGSGTGWLRMRDTALVDLPVFIDTRDAPWWGPLRGLFRSALGHDDMARVIGKGVKGVPAVSHVEVVLDERELRKSMMDFTHAYLIFSFIVSAFVAVLKFFVLHRFFVRPVQRLTTSISGFAEAPEDASRIIVPSERTDEIGLAERALNRMETRLAGELRQKRHLAELGLSVSKINHELRNMLTTAQLLGDRLSEVEDPTVKGIAPRLIRTLNRAIAFCSGTLAYGRAIERPPEPRRVALGSLVAESADLTRLASGLDVRIETHFAHDMTIHADPEQMTRVIANLVRNAVQAHAAAGTETPWVRIGARREHDCVLIRISDNGPGVPGRIRDQLFNAFATDRSGGTGLGLVIADELVRLHGGTIAHESTPHGGATFLIRLPDPQNA